MLEKPRRTILIVRGTTLDEATAPGELDCEYCPFTCESESRINRSTVANWIPVVLIALQTFENGFLINGPFRQG